MDRRELLLALGMGGTLSFFAGCGPKEEGPTDADAADQEEEGEEDVAEDEGDSSDEEEE